eukprot:gene12929-14261_t
MADEVVDEERWPVELKCETCRGSVHPDDNFCSSCGAKMDMEAIAIRTYFCEGYEYKVILAFLAKYHDIKLSLRTLKNRLKSMGLGRRGQQFDEREIRTRRFGGCPVKVRSDLGTENGIVASAQAFFRNDLSSHTYGTSPHNQRIEVIQENLNRVKSHWNSHYIRKSRHETIAGRPNELYFLPELHDAQSFIQEVADQDIQTVFDNFHVQPKKATTKIISGMQSKRLV